VPAAADEIRQESRPGLSGGGGVGPGRIRSGEELAEQLNLKALVESLSNSGEVSVELYAGPEVLCGRLTCPAGARLSDLLNDSASVDGQARSTFLEFAPTPKANEPEPREEGSREYIRKSVIDLLTVSDRDLGRRTGTTGLQSAPWFRKKSPARVIIQLGTYTLIGDIHCNADQTVHDVLNDDAQFLPLTDVTMVRDSLVYGTRPFVAVNKREIISCREETRFVGGDSRSSFNS
jgi:hypothetical protein